MRNSTPKSKKTPIWYKCESCSANIPSANAGNHPSECPSTPETCKSPFVTSGMIVTLLDVGEVEEAKSLSNDVTEDLIYISYSALELCNFVIGDRVMIKPLNNVAMPMVRRVWPLYKPLSSSLAAVNYHC
jgi:hypothetical protein